MSGKLGHTEAVAMSLGALIGGGIFAVLGVAANIAGNAVLISYTIAGIIALASGYSYAKLSEYYQEDGGSFLYIKKYSNSVTKAGMISWFLILGYIGSMAMYAYAFGAFLFALLASYLTMNYLFHGFFSVTILIVFLLVNLKSVESSGKSESLMVYGKITILLLFGLVGIATLDFATQTTPNVATYASLSNIKSPLMAISVIFVSFQGFQLLSYNTSELEGGTRTLRKAIFQSLIIATFIYLLIAFVTTSLLTPVEILETEETVLAYAATKMLDSLIIQQLAYFFVAFAALFSTASAINATLFSTARLISKVAEEDQMPSFLATTNEQKIPVNALVILTGVTGLITILGSLHEITAYASLSFLIIFSVVNFIAIRSSQIRMRRSIPMVGLIGTGGSFLLFLWYTLKYDPEMLLSITILFAIIIILEVIYFTSKHMRYYVKRRTPPVAVVM